MSRIYLVAAACTVLLSLTITVGAAPRASADLIFDQTVDLTVGFMGSTSDFNSGTLGQQRADDFRLNAGPGASTITDIHWWGFYSTNAPVTDDFTIRIFADISGVPEIDPLNEFAVGAAVNRVDAGADFVFAYSVDIAPLTLAANTNYWLSIVNDTTSSDFDDWAWGSNDVFAPEGAAFRREDGQVWVFSPTNKLGFQLTNDAVAVPEPATWALFAAGLAGLGWMSRRRKTKG